MNDFKPTHKITLTGTARGLGGEDGVILVSAPDDSAAGPAYTEMEWLGCANHANFERQSDGTWTFMGEAFWGTVEEMPYHAGINVEAAQAEYDAACVAGKALARAQGLRLPGRHSTPEMAIARAKLDAAIRAARTLSADVEGE
jgi:hypothetical protein